MPKTTFAKQCTKSVDPFFLTNVTKPSLNIFYWHDNSHLFVKNDLRYDGLSKHAFRRQFSMCSAEELIRMEKNHLESKSKTKNNAIKTQKYNVLQPVFWAMVHMNLSPKDWSTLISWVIFLPKCLKNIINLHFHIYKNVINHVPRTLATSAQKKTYKIKTIANVLFFAFNFYSIYVIEFNLFLSANPQCRSSEYCM